MDGTEEIEIVGPLPTRTKILCPYCLGHGFPPSTLRGFNKYPRARETCMTCKGEGEVWWPNAALPDPRMVRCGNCRGRMPKGFHTCIRCGSDNPHIPPLPLRD